MAEACCANCKYVRYLPNDDAFQCRLRETDCIEHDDFCQNYEVKTMKDECCGRCKYHKHEDIDDGWVCVNPDSDYCTDFTEYDDYCSDFEER